MEIERDEMSILPSPNKHYMKFEVRFLKLKVNFHFSSFSSLTGLYLTLAQFYCSNMDILKKSDKLYKEARKIILTSGFHDILASFSTVFYTGSYALNLMVWSDIDIEIFMYNSPFNKEIFFEIGK